jgi:dTDP-4-dehydrorhamnose 3,5-epimerase
MRFLDIGLSGAWLVKAERLEDERGFFARTWCEDEYARAIAGTADAGEVPRFVQNSISFNRRRGTLRGMHYQAAPSREGKLVRCTAGAIFDVVIDLRPGSATFLEFASRELSQQNRHALYIPAGFAHGFQTLCDDTEVLYQMTDFFQPELGRGLRWNDPMFAIPWPDDERIINARDAQYPDFDPVSIDPGSSQGQAGHAGSRP